MAGCAYTSSPPAGTTTPIPGEVVVFAASSLQEAFNDLAAQLTDKVAYNFASSRTLVTQLEQGAKADVLATADGETMQDAIKSGVVEVGSERVLATNILVIATAPGSSNVKTLQDLARPGVKLVLAEESVPAGKYALQVLDRLAADPAYGGPYRDSVLANVVSRESNVRQTLAKVRLGEADAGIVYVTDARSTQEVGTVEIPAQFNVVARYYIAPVKGSANNQLALLFIGYTLSAEGQATLAKYGFGPAEEK